MIAVIGILAFAASGYNPTYTIRRQAVDQGSQTLLNFLREARTLALSGAVINEGQLGEQTPDGGFGLFFDASEKRVEVFADVDDDGMWDSAGDDGAALSISEALEDYVELQIVKTDSTANGSTQQEISRSETRENDVWILFDANSLEITFGCAGCGGSEVIDADQTKQLEIIVGIPDQRAYSIAINKVSRFLDMDLCAQGECFVSAG